MKLDINTKNRIADMFRSGKTMAEIGASYLLSRERIRQILSSMGISKSEGGASIRAKEKKELQKELWLNSWLPKYKCLRKDYLKIIDDLRSRGISLNIALKFIRQKINAKKRGIDFNITFPEWYGVWVDSGKLNDMGRGIGKYCMGRYGDAGPYQVGNVEIISSIHNSSEGIKKRWGIV